MSARKAAGPTGHLPSVEAMSVAVLELDTRRRTQIANQVKAINRLLVNGDYGAEMSTLHALLSEAMQENNRLRDEITALQGKEPEDRLETSREAIRFTLGRKARG